MEDRDKAIDQAQILFLNPDILHASILNNHAKWAGFLSQLKYIVVDEVHTYHGVLGAHCAWVFRRLRRLIARLGNASTQWIAFSATLGLAVRRPGAISSRHIANSRYDAVGSCLLPLWD
jgi:DEAD/DEAH box helicase domain-containing protein